MSKQQVRVGIFIWELLHLAICLSNFTGGANRDATPRWENMEKFIKD